MPERVVEEGERVVPRQCDEPKRHLRQVYGDGVAVDAVQAPLRDQPARMDPLVLVSRDVRHQAVRAPRLHESVAEVAACLDTVSCWAPLPRF